MFGLPRWTWGTWGSLSPRCFSTTARGPSCHSETTHTPQSAWCDRCLRPEWAVYTTLLGYVCPKTELTTPNPFSSTLVSSPVLSYSSISSKRININVLGPVTKFRKMHVFICIVFRVSCGLLLMAGIELGPTVVFVAQLSARLGSVCSRHSGLRQKAVCSLPYG